MNPFAMRSAHESHILQGSSIFRTSSTSSAQPLGREGTDMDNNRVTILPTASDGAAAGRVEVSIERVREDLHRRSNALGGRWARRPAGLCPFERTLNAHAREIQIAALPFSTLVLIGFVYYALITVLGVAYGWLVAELQAW